ncbi:MAG TPA: hypothetical protein VMU94_09025 [Streptosporangiaceae bacterium]|nr:hypothetical protein [Streptosporangiaceae bacterium]
MTELASEEPRAAWVSIAAPPGGGTHMRLRDAEGRVVVDAVYIHGPEITATTLQGIPVSYLLLAANLMSGVGAALFDIVTWLKYSALGPPVHEEPAAGEPSLAELRAWAEGAPGELSPLVERAGRDPLTRPDGTDPDGFSARVAKAYREYAMHTRAPAVEIAREAAVPVATARSWIREARRRGHLPQGQRGKAG